LLSLLVAFVAARSVSPTAVADDSATAAQEAAGFSLEPDGLDWSVSGPDADPAESFDHAEPAGLDADSDQVAAEGFPGGPGPDPEHEVADPEHKVADPEDEVAAAGDHQPDGPTPAGALLAAQQTDPARTPPDAPRTPQDQADRDLEEIRGQVDTAVRYARDFAETADRTGERLDVAMASLTAAWVQLAQAVAGAADNAAAATRNGIPSAWHIPHDLTVTDVGFVLGTVELGYPPPAVRLALGTAGPGDPPPATPWTPSFVADWARHAAQFSQVAARTALELTAMTGHDDRTAEGRSQLAWAARCAANASQAAANIAHEASRFDPDDPRMANDAKQAQEYADRAAAQADAAAARLGEGTGGAES